MEVTGRAQKLKPGGVGLGETAAAPAAGATRKAKHTGTKAPCCSWEKVTEATSPETAGGNITKDEQKITQHLLKFVSSSKRQLLN